ncbi:hypothetical protein B0O99DRAFT_637706 [Bisporella sp. PMI_857]|nr:hypothetical protein B0O99DRAFT_637706 [Bisporella sp. PMI_857]
MTTAHEQDISNLVTMLHQTKITESFPTGLVDTCTAIAELIDKMANLPTNPPSIYMDLEGVKLSRHGPISILRYVRREFDPE